MENDPNRPSASQFGQKDPADDSPPPPQPDASGEVSQDPSTPAQPAQSPSNLPLGPVGYDSGRTAALPPFLRSVGEERNMFFSEGDLEGTIDDLTRPRIPPSDGNVAPPVGNAQSVPPSRGPEPLPTRQAFDAMFENTIPVESQEVRVERLMDQINFDIEQEALQARDRERYRDRDQLAHPQDSDYRFRSLSPEVMHPVRTYTPEGELPRTLPGPIHEGPHPANVAASNPLPEYEAHELQDMYPVEGHEFDLAEEDFAQPAGLSLGDAFPGIELAEESLTGGRSGQQFAISEEELARPAGLSLSDAFPGLELEEEADSIAEQDAATAASSESGEEQPVAGSRKKFRREIETRCNAPADTDWSPLAAREITAEEIFKFAPLCTAQPAVAFRLASNGWSAQDIADGINLAWSLTEFHGVKNRTIQTQILDAETHFFNGKTFTELKKDDPSLERLPVTDFTAAQWISGAVNPKMVDIISGKRNSQFPKGDDRGMLTAVLETVNIMEELKDLKLSDFEKVVADYHLESDPHVKMALPKDTDAKALERVRTRMEKLKSRGSGYKRSMWVSGDE